MADSFNELLQLLERTNVTVEFDRTKVGYINYGPSEVEAGIKPDEEDRYYYYIVKVDGYSSLIKYSKRVDFLIQEFNKELENWINDKVYYKDVKNKLEKIKSVVLPIYSNLDISSFSDQTDIRERGIGNKNSYYFKPNIYINYVNGTELDSDFGEFRIIEKFVDKKFYLAKRMETIAQSNLELLKEQGGGKKFESFKFKEERLPDSPRFTNFRIGLIDNGLIDKIDARLFSKCFSGKEVDKKINWKEKNKLSLAYFVRRLAANHLIENEDQWVALSNSFLFDSKTIIPNVFSTINRKKPPNKKIRGIIDEIIRQLA